MTKHPVLFSLLRSLCCLLLGFGLAETYKYLKKHYQLCTCIMQKNHECASKDTK